VGGEWAETGETSRKSEVGEESRKKKTESKNAFQLSMSRKSEAVVEAFSISAF